MATNESDPSNHPEPLPQSLGSDEESFVVLWKDTEYKSVEDVNNESDSSGIAKEAKSLIRKELNEIDESLSNKVKLQTGNKSSNDNPNLDSAYTDKKMVEDCQVDQLSSLFKIQLDEGEIGQDDSSVISITTFSNGLTLDQVQKKISDLIEENTRLKCVIAQNIATMKSQCQKIITWQEDVQKVHETHRTKIIEAKSFIEKLKTEKYNLTRELEQMKEDKNTQERMMKEKEKIIQEKLYQSVNVDAKVKELEFIVSNLKEENTVLNRKLEDRNKEVTMLQNDLYVKGTEAEESKAELTKIKSLHEDELKSLNLIIESLRLQEFCLLTTPASSQFGITQIADNRTATYNQIENLNKEIYELKSKVVISQSQVDEIHALKTQLELCKADFEAERNAKQLLQADTFRLSREIQKWKENYDKLHEKMNTIREKYFLIPKSVEYQRPEEDCCIQ